MRRGWGVATAFAVAIIVVRAGFHHFTWWGFCSFALYLFLKATDKADDRELFFASVAVIIALGVLSMATLNEDGSMLSDAYTELGPVGYFAGTFLVHYLPPSVILASMKSPVWSLREVTLLSGGLALFAVYLSCENPDEIYGVSVDSAVASGAAVAGIAVSSYGLWLFAGP